MLGAIIGDIAGSRFEFHPTNNYNFDFFTPHNRFTDDTVCIIAVANALLTGSSYADSLRYWCHRFPRAGYGGMFRRWLTCTNPQPYGSFGNGSAMRVSPVGWWFSGDNEILAEAERSAECTHNHFHGILGAQAVALAIADCRKLRMAKRGEQLNSQEIRQGLSRARNLYAEWPELHEPDIEKFRNRFDVTCQGTVPVALAIVEGSTCFEDAVRRAVSLGADADTIGAIAGSIAEAIWDIPEWMKTDVLEFYLTPELKEIVEKFYTAICS